MLPSLEETPLGPPPYSKIEDVSLNYEQISAKKLNISLLTIGDLY